MNRQLPTDAASLPVSHDVVTRCLELDQATDQLFARAGTASLAALSPAERRGALAGVTGHVAETVVEILLADLG